jgi:hypothetical protein
MKAEIKYFMAIIFFLLYTLQSIAQVEVEPWGNITGIRIDGQLMEFQTNLSVVSNNWSHITATAKERQRPHYNRNSNTQIISTNIDSLYFKEEITDIEKSTVAVNISATAKSDMPSDAVYFSLILPGKDYTGGSMRINHLNPINLDKDLISINEYLRTPVDSLEFNTSSRRLKIDFEKPQAVILKRMDGNNNNFTIYIPIEEGRIKAGQTFTKNFSITVSGTVDKKPITLQLNTGNPGRKFDGLGGNFRLQNPRIDPEVIDYCLKNLRVAWGRVEMPWMQWQPDINADPIAAAKAGNLNHHVQQSMEMAQRLYKMGIPVILSAWFPPQWAVIGPLHFRPTADNVWGNPLDSFKTTEIYKSIADYIQYLKDEYGVEIADFSFNESDLGINVRQTGAEHAELIKGLGAYFEKRGLKTKLLLGDNSDATTFQFIEPALNDPAAHPYIGAVSFHSWRGWDAATLQKWANAATQLKLPLLVGEGSIDAQAWGYPDIFKEQTYALEEINLYVRLLAICQPESILQWQLTSDYSLLAGGGVFGDTTKSLHPTQRFWNLKQLAATPKGLNAMPLSVKGANVTGAALGDNVHGIYTIHLVNNGAGRKVTLSGLPKKIKRLRVWITDKNKDMQEEREIKVADGKAVFQLTATSFTTLSTE